jgi:hypothetical protein
MRGQPPETASMIFESARSIEWLTVSFTRPPALQPRSSSAHNLRRSILGETRFAISVRAVAADRTREFRRYRQSGRRERPVFQGDPTFQWDSSVIPNQYCLVNSALVSAAHNFSGVVRMNVT